MVTSDQEHSKRTPHTTAAGDTRRKNVALDTATPKTHRISRADQVKQDLVNFKPGKFNSSHTASTAPYELVSVTAKNMSAKNAPSTSAPISTANLSKVALTPITVSMLPKEKPDLSGSTGTKDSQIAAWLTQWITEALKKGTLTEQHVLPRKAEIATYLGVSIGTVQNAIRYIEDEGHVESKQRIGTVLRNASQNGDSRMRKQTSKREQAVVAIQQLILARGNKPGEALPSAREIAKLIGSAPNTTRLALEFLATQGIVLSQGYRGNKANWYLQALPDAMDVDGSTLQPIESETLIDQLERDLKALIAKEFDVNAKLPSHLELAESFRVSIKTVHDAMKRLIAQGIVHSKRGRYGTFVFRKPNQETLSVGNDVAALFLPAEEVSFYNYQRVETHLKELIRKEHKVGDKLPPMGKLAETLGVSSNTIRKALQALGEVGVVSFTRGRFGGTFVKQMPKDVDAKAPYSWLSVNPATSHSYGNTTGQPVK